MLRELNYRESGDLQVSLDLDTQTQRVFLTVTDHGMPSQYEVPGPEASLAFEHPFAWLGRRVAVAA